MLRVLCPLLLLSVMCRTAHCIVAFSSASDLPEYFKKKQEHSEMGITLPNSLSKGVDTVTICARFLTYQFGNPNDPAYHCQKLFAWGSPQLESCAFRNTSKIKVYTVQIGEGWVDWKPQTWNTACMTLSHSKKTASLIFNLKTVLEYDEYGSYHFKKGTIVRLMNSHFGRMTDVNIWNRSLSLSEVEQWTQCEGVGGNMVDWEMINWKNVDGVQDFQQIEVTKEEVCGYKTTIVGFDEIFEDQNETVLFCRKYGGEMAVARSKTSLAMMLEQAGNLFKGEVVNSKQTKCSQYFFAGYDDIQDEGYYVDIDDNPVDWSVWNSSDKSDKTDGSNPVWLNNCCGGEDCLAIVYNGSWAAKDIHCNDYDSMCPICELPAMNAYQLQGVCEQSSVDQFYVLQSAKSFLGFIQTKLVWASADKRWEIVDLITSKKLAYNNDSVGVPLGTHPWYFNDMSNCNDNGKSYKSLNFHVAVEQPGEYCCQDGGCIDSELVCDGNEDCQDKTDEDNCKMLTNDTGDRYNKESPPRLRIFDGLTLSFPKTKVKAQVEILKIVEVNEIESWFYLTFGLTLIWKDQFLNYTFLKDTKERNPFVTDDIWFPKIKFWEEIQIKELNKLQFVKKTGIARMAKDSRNETYPGSENELHIETINRGKFICSFDNIRNYPYKIQNCSFEIFIQGLDNNLTNLEADSLVDSGPKIIGQYRIKAWSVDKTFVISNKSGLTFTVELARDVESIYLVTYLPTILMNLINQATNYISSPDKYELIIEINITCMMVLASIYLSVSSSLPFTVEIKPIETWLLFSLIYPFLIIIFNILIQKFKNESEDIIVHIKQVAPIGGSEEDTENPDSISLSKKKFDKTKLCEFAVYRILPSIYIVFVIVYFVSYTLF